MKDITLDLKLFFKERNIKQKEIAERLNMSQPNVSAMLNGTQPFSRVSAARWEKEFGLSQSWLMTGEGEMLAGRSTGDVEVNDNAQFAQGDINNMTLGDALEVIKKQQESIDKLINLLANGK